MGKVMRPGFALLVATAWPSLGMAQHAKLDAVSASPLTGNGGAHPTLDDPTESVAVLMYSTKPVRLQLAHTPQTPALVECNEACEAYVPAGRYYVYAHGGEGTAAGGRYVELTASGELLVVPRSTTRPWTGLALGMSGGAVLGAGIACAIFCSHASPEEPEPSNHTSPPFDAMSTAAAGFSVSVLVAAPLSIVGWILYGQGYTPAVRFETQGEAVAFRKVQLGRFSF
jgi:hypothetical protein